MAVWFHALYSSGESWSGIPVELELVAAGNDVRPVFYFVLRLVDYNGEG